MNKHHGRFNWRKYSRYTGNLKEYWTDPTRTVERHYADDE